MAWTQYAEYIYPTELYFEKIIIWMDSVARLYFAMKVADEDDWTYFSGNAAHGLASGSLLVNRGTTEADAQTNYWRPTPDSDDRVLGVLPGIIPAKYIRIYVDDANDNPTVIHEFRPSSYFAADEIITGHLRITDDFASPPKLSVIDSGYEVLRIGDLNGYLDYAAQVYGFAVSTDANNFVTIDPTNGFRISSDKENAITILGGGDIKLVGDDSNPGKIIWDGSSVDLEMYASTSGTNLWIAPSGDDEAQLNLGATNHRFNTTFTVAKVNINNITYTDATNYNWFQMNNFGFTFTWLIAGDDKGIRLTNEFALKPATTNILDLGTSANKWKDGYFAGDVLVSRLGVGAAPTFGDLTVYNTSSPVIAIVGAHDTDADPQIRFLTDASPSVKFAMGVDGADDKFKIFSGTGIGGTTEFVIDGSGQVGIATDSPDTTLQVVGDTKFGDDDTNYATFAADGELTLVGTAKITKGTHLEPDAVRLPGVNPPAEDEEDNFPFHRYDRGTEESVYTHWEIPEEYASAAAIHVHFVFIVQNPPSGSGDEAVVMGVEYKKISSGEVFDFDAGTSSGTVTEVIADGESAKKIHHTSEISLTTAGFGPMDVILFRFYRDATNGADTYDNEGAPADNDVWVKNYHIEYVADKLGEAT